ncbi:hypothetical protein WR25_12036 [Diploscapter pachys]|uniref:Uncharacterized protein n=1 Tax=Diploscapter pachys TaxID=2018661 RepID=A0A2A2KWU3_9BILA|nr:hypothetical protein WR25_12036 [Diploscapter pachys]
MTPQMQFLFLMLVIATSMYVSAELPIDENKPLDRARRYTSWGDFGAAISPWNSAPGNRARRYSSWGDLGASLSPWNSVSANHARHPSYVGGGDWSNFWNGALGN